MTNDEIMRKFSSLTGQLSPENLHCDGEISYTQAMRKLKLIKTEWKELEKTLGRIMTEEEVFQWDLAEYKKNCSTRCLESQD